MCGRPSMTRRKSPPRKKAVKSLQEKEIQRLQQELIKISKDLVKTKAELKEKREKIKGGRVGVLPIMAYTGRLRPKGVPFPGFSYIKG